MATSLDGFISRQNDGEDFLSSENWETFTEIAEEAGCFVVGRKTYEVFKTWDNHSCGDVEAERLVLSNKENYEVDEDFTLINEVEEAVQIAKNKCDQELKFVRMSRNNSLLTLEHVSK